MTGDMTGGMTGGEMTAPPEEPPMTISEGHDCYMDNPGTYYYMLQFNLFGWHEDWDTFS